MARVRRTLRVVLHPAVITEERRKGRTRQVGLPVRAELPRRTARRR